MTPRERFIATITALCLGGCSQSLLTLDVRPMRMVRPKEVRAVARYTGAAGPADEIRWSVCGNQSYVSVDQTRGFTGTRTFEAFFDCLWGGFPTVTLLSGGRVVATATTAGPIVIGASE
jgi:hypothetical protein